METRDGGEVQDALLRIANERLVFVCAPELGSLFADAEPKEALAKIRQLHVQGRYDLWDRWASAMRSGKVEGAPSLKLYTAVSALEAASTGLGATVVYSSYCDALLKSGRLVAPLGDGVATTLCHCIVRAPNAKPRWHPAHQVYHWLESQFAETQAT